MEDEAREAQLANVTGDAALDAGHGDGVAELLDLLHVLVDEHDVEDAADQLENGHVSIDEAGGHRRCIVHPEASHALLERIGEHLLDETDIEDSEEEDLEEEKEDQKQSEDMWSDPGCFIDKFIN